MKAWNGKKLKKQIREKFPSIFRYIPELQSDLSIVHIRQYWFITLIVSCYCLLIFSLVIIGKRTADDFLYVTHLEKQRSSLLSQRHRWENVVNEHRGYRDGYFMLATLEYQLGN